MVLMIASRKSELKKAEPLLTLPEDYIYYF
jgi:hypothetical protein